ncbi:hypothetical protein LCGC14_1762450 [marine sediment metagenome]|uniref:Uncharacterized protein n=1 Tax=marine sediment metagenome TaxID=412755 RepID=A0A0F9HMZ4_9ZZZZ
MTWKEIKERIESQGITDDTEIRYIDSSCDYEVSKEEDGRVGIF